MIIEGARAPGTARSWEQCLVAAATWPARLSRVALLALLWLYRKGISPAIGPRCRFVPSCSAYAEQCLKEYGVVKALGKTIWRLLRCHPFCSGGHDPP